MTLEDLEKLELPVELVCNDGEAREEMAKIKITAFNKVGFLFIDLRGNDEYLPIDNLRFFESKSITTTEIESWLDVYPTRFIPAPSEDTPIARQIFPHFIGRIGIKLKYEKNKETGGYTRVSAEIL